MTRRAWCIAVVTKVTRTCTYLVRTTCPHFTAPETPGIRRGDCDSVGRIGTASIAGTRSPEAASHQHETHRAQNVGISPSFPGLRTVPHRTAPHRTAPHRTALYAFAVAVAYIVAAQHRRRCQWYWVPWYWCSGTQAHGKYSHSLVANSSCSSYSHPTVFVDFDVLTPSADLLPPVRCGFRHQDVIEDVLVPPRVTYITHSACSRRNSTTPHYSSVSSVMRRGNDNGDLGRNSSPSPPEAVFTVRSWLSSASLGPTCGLARKQKLDVVELFRRRRWVVRR
jgi:hypothetical protein